MNVGAKEGDVRVYLRTVYAYYAIAFSNVFLVMLKLL